MMVARGKVMKVFNFLVIFVVYLALLVLGGPLVITDWYTNVFTPVNVLACTLFLSSITYMLLYAKRIVM
jgi:hypothetical protein